MEYRSAVIVNGSDDDLEQLAQLDLGPYRVGREDDNLLLTSPEIEGATPGPARAESAARAVDVVAGIASVGLGRRVDLRPGPMVERDPTTGARTRRIVGSGSITLDAVIIGPGADPKIVAAETAAALASDPQAALVLQLYGRADTWEGLHKVLEAIEDDVGGDAKLKRLRLVRAKDIKRFTNNANAREKALTGGRHAKRAFRLPPGQEMTLAEARHLMRTLVEGWLRHSASNPRPSATSP